MASWTFTCRISNCGTRNCARSISATLRQVEGVVFKIVRHLVLEPQVDAQCRLVNFLIVGGVADRALFLELVLQILGHCLPPALVPETRVSPSAANCKPGASGQRDGNVGIQRGIDGSKPRTRRLRHGAKEGGRSRSQRPSAPAPPPVRSPWR